jgi:hypothetical protein
MRRSLCTTLRTILILALALSFLAGANKPVQAETCTWEGDGSTDWMFAGNWTCGHVPGSTDAVNIPVVTNFPVIYTNVDLPTPPVLSLTIEPDAFLTINQGMALDATTMNINGTLVANAASSPVMINFFTPGGVVDVGSTGTVTKLGSDNLVIYSTFINAGTVSGAESGTYSGGVALIRGGNHTGIFQGEYLYVGVNDYATGQVFNFNSGSQIRINQLHARGGTVNLFGSISQPENTGTYLFVQPSSGTCVVYFRTGLGILKMPETTFIEYGGKLILEAQSYDYSMQKLNLEYNGELQNNNALTITTQFNWKAGKITGVETTTVDTSATFTMGTSVYAANDFTLDGQTLVNNATANWNKRDLTLANSAEFINNGTFNANATTTMTGGETVTFTNNGTFFKNTPATTTTMNVGFINDGDVQINEGNLEFPLGMDNGDDTTIVLNGGRLDPGDELLLESGDSLIGSGTLTANLVNAGTVSPGASPGIITVDGDYTQQADGILEIQLGGTTPSLFDRLIVTGAASMAGTLNVTLLPGFSPQEGDTFFIVNHLISGTGNFSIENLPDLPGSLMFEIDYADPGVTLTVVSRSTDTFIFLPMIIK